MHTLILPIKVTSKDDAVLNKRFNLLAREHNILVKHTTFLNGFATINGIKKT